MTGVLDAVVHDLDDGDSFYQPNVRPSELSVRGAQWGFPPRMFERETGLKGISGGYTLPRWLCEAARPIVWGVDDRTLAAAYDCLRGLNPQIPDAVEIVHPRFALVDYFMGVLSDINLDDIAWYVENSGKFNGPGEIEQEIVALTGARSWWRVSPKTLEKIRRQVKNGA